MPRKKRTHYYKAFYHAMMRGNHRQAIFFNDNDRIKFYNYLADVVNVYDCRIHIFCLMSNHLHMVIEVGHIPLSKIMQNVISRFARYQNKQQNRKGHLCEGRYCAIPIQNEKYLLELCYYIHHNPVKAGIVSSIDDYRWSSHYGYSLIETIPWLTTEFVLKVIKKNSITGDMHYQNFIRNAEKNYTTPSFCIFDDNGELIICDAMNLSGLRLREIQLIKLSLEKIIEVICEFMQIPIEHLSSPSLNQKIVLARNMVTYFAHYRANYKLIDIAYALQRGVDSISKTTHKTLKLLNSNYQLKNLFITLERKLLQFAETTQK